MAEDLRISVWPERNTAEFALDFYRLLLQEFGRSKGGCDKYWSLEVFQGAYPIEWNLDSRGPNWPLATRFAQGKPVDEIVGMLEEFQGSEYSWDVVGSYQRLEWCENGHAVRRGSGNVDLSYYGAEFLPDGEHHFGRGAFVLSFEDVRHFTNSVVLYPPGVTPRQLRFVSNVETLFGIFRHLVSHLPIRHAAATVVAEVCPVNFHMVFHDCASAFENDVRKILLLHEQGGGYFYEGVKNHSLGPYKLIAYNVGNAYSSVSDVGRSEGEVAQLIERLDGISERLGIPDPGTRLLTDGEILETLVECPGIEVGEAGEGIYMIHPGTPFEFLAEPYFRLMERMVGKKGRVLPTVH